MEWQIELQTDVIRGHWEVNFNAWVWREVYYLVARKKNKTFVHFYLFYDWISGKNLLDTIKLSPGFCPENKPNIWTKVRSCKPLVPQRKKNAPKL